MATFLLIDPAAGRRAGLRVFLSPPHEVVECSSFRESLTACTGAAFKAAFIAWPQGVRPAEADSPNWSCEQVVLLISDTAQTQSAGEWCKRVLRQDKITLMHCLDGYLNSSEISRAVSRVLDTPAVVFPEMVGSSPAMRKLMELAARAAANDHSVLICGEPGTGKEALARWIHARSARSQRPFEPFDSSGLEPAAAFSELFGHEKGAFPWAAQAKRGVLSAANEGTLYIREVGDLDRALQSKLLRLLERPTAGIERLGGQESHNVDVRLIASSCVPVSQRVGEEFSRDLYYRLKQNYLETPPLRARPSDIPELARHFLTRLPGAASRGLKLEPRALSAMQRYQWPGNLDELGEVVAEAALKNEAGGEIKFEQLPPRIRNAADQADFRVVLTAPVQNQPLRNPPERGLVFPEAGWSCDGYTMLKIINSTAWARVFLTQGGMSLVLRIAKLSQARNEDQLEAVKKIMALGEEACEARKFMIPIHHANNCSEGPWYMVVLACLNDARSGRRINRDLYQPHTFREWITRLHRDRSLNCQDRLNVIDCLQQILGVLDFFHSNDLVMNDVKPENFGFYEDRLVVIDYGGFTFLGKEPHESTPEYSPPEPREGQPAEDVYAVAVMMAEALYNLPPGSVTPSNVEAIAKHYCSERRVQDLLAWHVIGTGLHWNQNVRYRTAQAMITDLKQLKKMIQDNMKGTDGTAPAE